MSYVDFYFYVCRSLKIDEIDMMAVSLESSLATVGGFSAGSSFVVDHQVIVTVIYAQYCFTNPKALIHI